MAKRQSTKLIELKRHAKKKGWLKWLRQGEGEEADERALLNGCWFVPQRGEHCVNFIQRHCRISDPGPWFGRLIELQDWQTDFLMRLMSWVRWSPEWERIVRRFRWAYLECPKKQGKSPLMASIGCYLLYADGNQSTRVFSVATVKKQAAIVHGNAIGMVESSPDLAGLSRIVTRDGYKAIEYPDLGSTWTIAAADAATSDGVNGSCLADELHRWVDWEFWNTLKWMLAAQPEGLFFAITTAGASMQSICRTQHDKTRAINDGRQHDDQFLGRIYAASPDDDPHDPKTWAKANPSLGRTRKSILKLSDFRSDYHAAVQDPTQWTDWLRLRLGIWKTAEDAWVDTLGGLHRWDAGAPARGKMRKRIDCFETFDLDRVRGWPCWFGLDGATHHDTTAAVFVFPDPGQDEVLWIWPRFWLPAAEAHRLGAKVPYQYWSEQGLITLTDGDACDYARIKSDLVELLKGLDCKGFAFDPLFQAEWLTQQIAEESGVSRTEFPQTIVHFTRPMKTLGRLIVERKVRHNGHALLTWQLGHTRAYSDPNQNVRPVKQKPGDPRTIDGVVAAIMAVGLATSQEDDRPVWYDDDEHDVEYL